MKTEKELLDYAKEHYPIGTKFISPQNQKPYTVKGNYKQAWLGNEIMCKIKEQDNLEYLEYGGKWAEIISLPQPFTDYNDVTYEMITTHSYFRTLSEKELEEIVGYMNYEGYKRLPGEGSDKVKNLIRLFDKEEEFILPEVWHVKVTEENKKVLSDWKGCNVEVSKIVGMCKWFGSNRIEKGHNPATIINDPDYTFGEEITYEQFLKYVLKQETKINMKSFKITRNQFKQLYDVACSTWKSKVKELTETVLGTFQQEGELSYETVEEMFKAISNDEQRRVFTSIFSDFSNDKSVDLSVATNEGLFGRTDSMIQIHCNGEFKNKAFYLSNDYDWKLNDEYYYKGPILIPTHK